MFFFSCNIKNKHTPSAGYDIPVSLTMLPLGPEGPSDPVTPWRQKVNAELGKNTRGGDEMGKHLICILWYVEVKTEGTHRGSWKSLRSFWSQQSTGSLETTGEMWLSYGNFERISQLQSWSNYRCSRNTFLHIPLLHPLNSSLNTNSFPCSFRYIITYSIFYMSS